MVPCNPEFLLDLQYYGDLWRHPEPDVFKVSNLNWAKRVNRTVENLPFVFRYYGTDGSLQVEETLSKINTFYEPLFGSNLTDLPPDDEDYF
jgi:hypothetical protein